MAIGMNDPNIEKIRDNINKENLKSFLENASEEAQKQKGVHFSKDFKEGFYFAIGMIRNFFKIR